MPIAALSLKRYRRAAVAAGAGVGVAGAAAAAHVKATAATDTAVVRDSATDNNLFVKQYQKSVLVMQTIRATPFFGAAMNSDERS